MKTIFGVFCRDTSVLPLSVRDNMQFVINREEIGVCQLWEGEGIGLVQTLDSTLSVDTSIVRSHAPASESFAFIAAGRLDNASELCSTLNIPELDRPVLSDHEVMRRAYNAWGESCSARMFGDWAFAAWNPVERQLVLSRSHYGSLPLYYHIDQYILAFASSRPALLALKLAPVDLDEFWLAQHLISWPATYGERTPHKLIKCLPPGTTLFATSSNCKTKRYWFPEDVCELRLSHREEYVEGFRSIFDEAVRCRLCSDGPIAVTLSGGLDSSAVAGTAARFLSTQGKRLTAYTSVPLYDPARYEAKRFGDEFPFAKATAEYAGNIDLHPLDSSEISPITCIRQVLQRGGVPSHGAGNLYWLMDIQQAAKAAGCNVLLTGAAGNAGISWEGDLFSQSWQFLFSQIARRTLIQAVIQRTRQRIKAALPVGLLAARQQQRMEQQKWYRNSAINPALAWRLRLLEQRLHDPDERPARNPREQRSRVLKPGRSVFGSYLTELGSANGLELRDPSADARVIDFVFSVPDHIFMDPKTGINRWLIREAMKGLVPDQVRLNRNRGLQGSDMVPRLRACAAEVECTLNELANGPAMEYVDVDYMRQIWQRVQTEDTPVANVASKQILLRGIMAGLFVNGFYE